MAGRMDRSVIRSSALRRLGYVAVPLALLWFGIAMVMAS